VEAIDFFRGLTHGRLTTTSSIFHTPLDSIRLLVLALPILLPRLWAGIKSRTTKIILRAASSQASMVTTTSSPGTAENGSSAASPASVGKKLHGRTFYESIGSPKFILAPMVDQSEFVHPLLLSFQDNLLTAAGMASPHSLIHESGIIE